MTATPGAIVVTGATGFTGPHAVRALAARFPGVPIRCLVRPSSRRSTLEALPITFVEGDLRDGASLDRAFAGCDTLVNVASLGFDWVDPLFDAIARSSLRRGVFVSTTAILTRLPVRSRPQREHGEARVRASGLDWTILRPTMIYGTPGDRNIARLIRFVQRSPVVPVIAAQARQQPVHVEDVAAAIAGTLATPATVGRVYELSGAAPVTFEELVRQTVAATGRRRWVVRLPFWPARLGVMLYNACVPRPPVSVEQLERLREDKAFDHAAAARDFGYRPRTFADGVAAEAGLVGRGGRPSDA
jgi:uncharacterized protein YbjT (DUF2867 family)